MRAIVYDRFGPPDVLELREVPDPRPSTGEVLVKVHAAGLNPKDVLVRKGKMRLLSGKHFPRIPSHDFAGEVIELGRGVKGIAVGDHVYGFTQRWAGDACAELLSVPIREIALKPTSLNWHEAAAAPLAAQTALQGLRDLMALKRYDSVCINGASGGVGSYAVQIAALLGATVTGVCSHRNVDRVSKLGAAHVVDYTKQDLGDRRGDFSGVMDAYGNWPYPKARALLEPGGRYVTLIPRLDTVVRELLSRLGVMSARLVIVKSNTRDLDQLRAWFDAGDLVSPIDRVYPLTETIEAHRYIETRRAQGKIVIDMTA